MNFRRRLPITFLVAAASIINAASVAGAVTIQNQQGEDIYLELRNRAVSPVTLAVPTFSTISGAEGEANILRQVLWNDLDYSMVFDLVDSEFYPNIESGDGPPDFTAWRQTSAEALIRGFVRRQGDDLTVEFRLYDVASGQQIIGKRYYQEIPVTSAIISNTQLRGIAHEFNDEAVFYFPGQYGAASTRIAYVSSNRPGPKEIHLMDYDGYGDQRITNDGGFALNPAFSPDGEQIAYVAYRTHDGIPNVDIAMLNKGGGIPPVVIHTAGQDSSPDWSPDGSRLVFSSTKDGISTGNSEIYTSRPDGSDLQRITNNSEIDTSPTYSPNGREIAFISTRGGGQHLYKMSIDGINVRRLPVEGTQIDSPAWNPNPQLSDLIAYAASEGGNRFQVFVYSLSSGRSVPVTSGYGRADSPNWSPDGRQIVFEAAQGNQTHIFAVGLDGSRLRQLTREGANQSPSWGGR
jgi:TolB protein